jgi:hypothetical protein
MFHFASTASANEIVTALVNEPVEHPEEKEDCQGYEFVNIKGAPQNQSQKQKMKNLLLRFVHYVL